MPKLTDNDGGGSLRASSEAAAVAPVSLADTRKRTVWGAVTRLAWAWRRAALLSLAAVCFSLGVLGAFLPGLPATPFLLLTSFLLVRSSPRLHAALLRSPTFGPILTDWQRRGGVRRHVKIKAILAVVATVAVTLFLSRLPTIPALVVITLAGVGVAVILRVPTLK